MIRAKEYIPTKLLQFCVVLGVALFSTLALATVTVTTYFVFTEIGAPSLPAAGSSGIYADSTSHTIKASVNGGAWSDIVTALTGSTLYCLLSGCTMTGQMVFSGVATDITTGANQDLTLAPNGTGQVIIATAQLGINTVAFDQQGAISNSSANTCNSAVAGGICLLDTQIAMTNTGSSEAISIWSTAATNNNSRLNMYGNGTGFAGLLTFTGSPGSPTAVGSMAYYAASAADADYADKMVFEGSSKMISLLRADDVAAGTVAVEFRDNAAATGVVLASITGGGTFSPLLYGSQTNCADSAGAAACAAAPAGAFVVDATTTSTVVSTTAVTANSEIFVGQDSSLGTRLGVTCNTTPLEPIVTARTAATSFTVTLPSGPVTNPECLTYHIIN